MLFADFKGRAVDLLPRKEVANAAEHPEKVIASAIKYAEVSGIITGDKDTKFRERDINAHDIDTINKYLEDEQDQHIGADEKPVTADDVDIEVHTDKEANTRYMLRKH